MSQIEQEKTQIQFLKVKSDQPLIITDADEVLVHFAAAFEGHLNSLGFSINFTSYKIFGNIYGREDNKPLQKQQVMEILKHFFMAKIDTCLPVLNVVQTLNNLSQDHQIIILTNTPYAAKLKRQMALKNIGIDFPLITNEGHKGGAVKEIISGHRDACFFIDDIPHHHTSVMEHCPQVQRIHFVADERLQRLLPKAEDSHVRIDNWLEVAKYIRAHHTPLTA